MTTIFYFAEAMRRVFEYENILFNDEWAKAEFIVNTWKKFEKDILKDIVDEFKCNIFENNDRTQVIKTDIMMDAIYKREKEIFGYSLLND